MATMQPSVSRIESEISMAGEMHGEEKPVRCLKFRQQDLWAVKPVWSPKCVAIMYYLVAVVFIPVGIAVLVTSLRMSFTDRLRYDNDEACDIGTQARNESNAKFCVIKVVLDRDLPANSFMYYGLVNFFQNARNYIKSRSAEELRGNSNPNRDDCKEGGAKNELPCGLTAQSRFTDSFRLCRDKQCESEVPLQKKGIAWEIDRTTRFLPGSLEDGYTEESNKLVTDEDFMVWMRLATYNNFHKLYRIIPEALPAGTYFVNITNRYPVEEFSGQKFIFFSETRWFGGRSRFLGFAYIIIGGVSFVMATLFLIRAGTAPQAEMPPETTIPIEGFANAPESSDAVSGPQRGEQPETFHAEATS